MLLRGDRHVWGLNVSLYTLYILCVTGVVVLVSVNLEHFSLLVSQR